MGPRLDYLLTPFISFMDYAVLSLGIGIRWEMVLWSYSVKFVCFINRWYWFRFVTLVEVDGTALLFQFLPSYVRVFCLNASVKLLP